MTWIIANTKEPYDGETHELLGKTYSGKTRTPASQRLEWVAEAPKPAAPSKPKAPKTKPAPKPKGATAWD